MKTMKNFAAPQQLTKKQMNGVKGGRNCAVHFKDQEQAVWYSVEIDDKVSAANAIYNSLSKEDQARVQNINC